MVAQHHRAMRRRCENCLHVGSCAVVRSIDRTHPSARRLLSMGLDSGCEIRVERVAPLGDPYMITLRGYSLALRRKDLDALDLKELEETGG